MVTMVTMVILSTLGWAINSPCDVMISLCNYGTTRKVTMVTIVKKTGYYGNDGKTRQVTMVTMGKQDMLPW